MIQPGLERIAQLLKDVHFPWKAVHVAGTNGKGSVCHNASALLRRRGLRVGRFTSPHVIDRWDCIWANGKVIEENTFKKIEDYYKRLSDKNEIQASPFEILTATAFHFFNEEKLDVGVIEVGMGGKLDATNILNNQIVSVISKIAMDHEGFLGNTIEEIAKHKAGILRPNIPYVVSPANDSTVQRVINEYATEIGAGPCIVADASELNDPVFSTSSWERFTKNLLPFQRDNAVLAVLAVNRALATLGSPIPPEEIGEELSRRDRETYPGRLQYHEALPVFPVDSDDPQTILIDGAHNPDAAKQLDAFVEKHQRRQSSNLAPPDQGWPVTWVVAMTSGKDASKFLKILLKPGDRIITSEFGPVDGMPWVKSMPAEELLRHARVARPGIEGVAMKERGVLKALTEAKHIIYKAEMLGKAGEGQLHPKERPIVLTGSLYFVADFLREVRAAET